MKTPSADELDRIIEALLFVGAGPLTSAAFCRAIPVRPVDFVRSIARLQRRYAAERRPYAVVGLGTGYCIQLTDEHRRRVEIKLMTERGVRLPRNVVEVLSVIAYQQPISRAELERLTGTEASGALRQLMRRQLVESCPADKENGLPERFITSRRFLELFGMESLTDLPATEDLQQL